MTTPDRPAPQFTWGEFACKDAQRTPYPDAWRLTRGVPLGLECERIRAKIGPFTPDSVFRTWAHHLAIYADMTPPQIPPARSQHLDGRAADIPKPAKMPWDEFQAHLSAASAEPESLIRYLCFYPEQGFAHIDIRPTQFLVVESKV